MVFQAAQRWVAQGLLVIVVATALANPFPAFGQQPSVITRKVKTRTSPAYPELARRMNISGTVKLVIVVAPDGSVKSTKVVGGHPLLVSAAEDAVKQWKFEPASEESSGVVEFSFKPGS